MSRPESIENRWDILYRDYPEVYDAFSKTPYHPTLYEALPFVADLRVGHAVDVGSGNGASTFMLAHFARQVTGVEIEPAMLRVAKQKLPQTGLTNVAFVCGDALALPLADASADLVTGVTLALDDPGKYRGFIREGLRVSTGQVVYVGIPPGTYGGNLADHIDEKDPFAEPIDRIFRTEFGFDFEDLYSTQDYGTVEHIVATYGFIFGRRVIDHIRRNHITSIRWTFRVYTRGV